MRKILQLLGLMLFCYASFGQDNRKGNYRVMVTPTQFIFNDYILSVEKWMGRHTLGLSLGYRPSTQDGGEVEGGSGLMGYYEHQNMWNELYNAGTIGLNSKYYFGESRKFFGELQLFYRNWWFDNKQAIYTNIEGYRFDGLRSEEQNVYGLKLMAGRSFRLIKGNRNALVVDIYAGIGVRYKTLWFETTEGMVGDKYFSYRVDTGHGINAGPQAGLKIGFERFINLSSTDK